MRPGLPQIATAWTLGLVAGLAAGCSRDVDATPPMDTASGADTGAGPDGGATHDDSRLTAVSARLHDDIGSMVIVSWDQAEPGTSAVRYMVDPGRWHSTPPVHREAGHHEQLVLGVPYEHPVRLQVTLETDAGDRVRSSAIDLETAPWPDGLPRPVVRVHVEERTDPSTPWLLGSVTSDGAGWGSNWWVFILDRKGRTVWAWESPDERVTMFARPSLDGSTILVDLDSYWWLFDGGAASEVARIDIEGRELQRWPTPGLHHAFIDLPEGGIAWGGHGESDEYVAIVDDAGDIEQIWSCADLVGEPWAFSCITNAIWLDTATDRFLVSVVSTDSVVVLDRQSGAQLDLYGSGRSAWAFDPPESAFSHQHDPHLTDEGTLLVSTNGIRRERDTAVREYELDEESHTLRQIWSFGDGEGIHADRLGTVQRLPGGNTQHGLGSAGRLREITPEGDVAWDVDWGEENELGRTTAFEDIYRLLDGTAPAVSR
ncbi:MAG: hypothetical protein D6798_04725 [Deltaproteobacteria bacterium]|nr:MAG: hypothetical protein D6798_04725 [Deltaproteobacteria bacterium]